MGTSLLSPFLFINRYFPGQLEAGNDFIPFLFLLGFKGINNAELLPAVAVCCALGAAPKPLPWLLQGLCSGRARARVTVPACQGGRW